jgi:hypothetical protein
MAAMKIVALDLSAVRRFLLCSMAVVLAVSAQSSAPHVGVNLLQDEDVERGQHQFCFAVETPASGSSLTIHASFKELATGYIELNGPNVKRGESFRKTKFHQLEGGGTHGGVYKLSLEVAEKANVSLSVKAYYANTIRERPCSAAGKKE